MVTTLVGIGQDILRMIMVALLLVITEDHIVQTNASQSVKDLLRDGNKVKCPLKCNKGNDIKKIE